MAFVSRFTLWLEECLFRRGGSDYHYADLARDIGVSKNTVSAWKTKKKTPRREHIHLLAIHFGDTSRAIYKLLDLAPPDGLNDTYEQVAAIVYRLTHSEQSDVLCELEKRYGTPADIDKKAREMQ